MNNQTVYLAVRAPFTAPGARLSVDDNGDCYYRHPEDLAEGLPSSQVRKCAAGCTMPDDLYEAVSKHESIEGTAWNTVADYCFNADAATTQNLYGDVDVQLMMEMQNAHDNSSDTERFVAKLDEIARKYDLVVPA